MANGIKSLQPLGRERLVVRFFLIYEAKLIRSGYSPTEVMSALTSMQVELGTEPNELSENLEEDLPPRFTWPVMRMEIRSILKSLGGGEVHDVKAVPEVIKKVKGAENSIADKGYDSEAIREQARTEGMNPVIPRKSNSTKSNPEFDFHLYKMHHLVENLFARLNHFRSVATRFEKLARNFKSIVFLACTVIWLRLGK